MSKFEILFQLLGEIDSNNNLEYELRQTCLIRTFIVLCCNQPLLRFVRTIHTQRNNAIPVCFSNKDHDLISIFFGYFDWDCLVDFAFEVWIHFFWSFPILITNVCSLWVSRQQLVYRTLVFDVENSISIQIYGNKIIRLTHTSKPDEYA